MSETRNSRRSLQGVVVSDAMQETITVRVERRYKHTLYGKFVRSHKKYMAHDAENAAKVGDLVSIMACRPISKRKRWRLERIISTTNVAPLATEGGEA
jgi:small subunit ribosomal protein S17